MKGFEYPGKSPVKSAGADALAMSKARLNNQEHGRQVNAQAKADNQPNLKKSPFLQKQKKRRKDIKVDNSDGTTRVKPVKTVKGSDGRVQVQQIKYADGSSHFNRYEDGKMVDQNFMPKKMRKKRIKKIRTKRNTPKLIKPLPMPDFPEQEVVLDAEDQAEYDRREELANKKKAAAERKKNRPVTKKVTDAVKNVVSKIPKIKRRPRGRTVKNLVTGKNNKLR